jgi:hypothetical protein
MDRQASQDNLERGDTQVQQVALVPQELLALKEHLDNLAF